MTELPRTVTLPTHDAGDVTLPEPAWCNGHEAAVPQYRADLTHYGPEQTLAFREQPVLTVLLAQAPCSETVPHVTGLYVELHQVMVTLDPAGVDELAATLVEHAAVLRSWARVLASTIAGEARR
ncbi:DUF6907 domain-containing protein [Actinacidiphila glaucinigra]|uniref:DUF6907 domain-containing protein n=1 Tax=Actinacidiphila glaucinigra TaxID=235986 RepID=UPI0035D5FE0E